MHKSRSLSLALQYVRNQLCERCSLKSCHERPTAALCQCCTVPSQSLTSLYCPGHGVHFASPNSLILDISLHYLISLALQCAFETANTANT